VSFKAEGRSLWVSLLAIIAVSSANVAMTVSFLVGMSAVNIKYRRGHNTLPWGTPE